MAIEAVRGCGYRKVGGLYLMGGKIGAPCCKFPYEVGVCPTCGGGISQTRGFKWINPKELLGECDSERYSKQYLVEPLSLCPIPDQEKAGLLWVGKAHYATPADFLSEAREQGISRRIRTLPKELKLGETWVFFGHPEAVLTRDDEGEAVYRPGLFCAFIPTHVEKLVKESELEEVREDLEKRGIRPVPIPDNDPDHN
jgi:hypothetical protein